MRRDQYFGSEARFLVLPLHSGIPSKMQREVSPRATHAALCGGAYPPPACMSLE
jgi:hypothetical protein